MPNNYLSVLYKHIIQVENENEGLKVEGGELKHTIAPPPLQSKKWGAHVTLPPPPPPLPTPDIYMYIYIHALINNCNSDIKCSRKRVHILPHRWHPPYVLQYQF